MVAKSLPKPLKPSVTLGNLRNTNVIEPGISQKEKKKKKKANNSSRKRIPCYPYQSL